VAVKHHPDGNQAGSRLEAAAFPALLILICIGFFWKLVLSDQYTWLDLPDNANQVLPWFQFKAGEWHNGRIPLWDPTSGAASRCWRRVSPEPPIDQLAAVSGPAAERVDTPVLSTLVFRAHSRSAALFCYWLCRDLKRSHAASLLSGLAFGLGGFMGTNTWPQMLNGAVWAPVVLLFFLRAMRGERPVASAAWSGVFLGIAFLSGHHQIPIFLSLAVGGAGCTTSLWNQHSVFSA